MKTFRALREIHEFRRHHLPFLQTIEDAELVREIGLSQASGQPMQLKTLFLQGIASAATVQRRLNRLRRLGIVHQSRADHDKRVLHLSLDPGILKLYEQMGRLMRKTLA